jgi:hypothetical protein
VAAVLAVDQDAALAVGQARVAARVAAVPGPGQEPAGTAGILDPGQEPAGTADPVWGRARPGAAHVWSCAVCLPPTGPLNAVRAYARLVSDRQTGIRKRRVIPVVGRGRFLVRARLVGPEIADLASAAGHRLSGWWVI